MSASILGAFSGDRTSTMIAQEAEADLSHRGLNIHGTRLHLYFDPDFRVESKSKVGPKKNSPSPDP